MGSFQQVGEILLFKGLYCLVKGDIGKPGLSWVQGDLFLKRRDILEFNRWWMDEGEPVDDYDVTIWQATAEYLTTRELFFRLFSQGSSQNDIYTFRTLIGWEFLFRGFLLFPLYEFFGPAANLIQATLCAVTHMHKPLAEMYGSLPFALLLGYLARRSGSVLYGVYVHWLLGFALEVYIAIGNKGSLPFF